MRTTATIVLRIIFDEEKEINQKDDQFNKFFHHYENVAFDLDFLKMRNCDRKQLVSLMSVRMKLKITCKLCGCNLGLFENIRKKE